MEVSIRGWSRDHGKIQVAQDKLYEINSTGKINTYPYIGSVIERITDIDGNVSGISYSKRVFIQANGNYQLQVSLSTKEILYLAWITMRKRPLEVLTEAFAMFKRKNNGPANTNKAA